MALRFRYVEVDELPEIGMTLASAPNLQDYADVLDNAADNRAKGNGAYYNEENKGAREVSYMYALNSVYRSLYGWQQKHPEKVDEKISALRQEIAELTPYFMEKEFPGIPFEIQENLVKYKTQDETTRQIINPQLFEIDAEQKERLINVIEGVVEFVAQNSAFNTFFEKENSEEFAEETEINSEETQKAVSTFKYRKMSSDERSEYNLFALVCKMCYYLPKKMENQHVYDYKTTEERANTLKKDLLQNVENITKQEKVDNSYLFSKNHQRLADKLNENGMDLVWYKEEPYEASFVKHLDTIQEELAVSAPAPEFYNTKLPLILKLSEDLQKCDLEMTEKLAQLHHIVTQSETPNTNDIAALVEETRRVAMEFREIDRAKSFATRAAWDGVIRNPDKESDPELKTEKVAQILRDRVFAYENQYQRNLTPEMQAKVDAYKQANYSEEDYHPENNKIWRVVSQVPQFKQLEKILVDQVKSLGIPPQDFEKMKYNDLTFLLNCARAQSIGKTFDNSGISISSDREKYFKNLVANHEKELRRSLQDFYTKRYMMQMVETGVAHKRSQIRIQKKVNFMAQQKVDKIIKNLREGRGNSEFNSHHFPPLSKIAQFERLTGQPFYKINESVLWVHQEMHPFFHINENAVDKNGKVRMDNDSASQTKYVHRDRIIKDGENVIGYYGSAVSCMIMPKRGMVAMIDCKSFIFDAETLQQNRALQKDMIELNKNYKIRGKRLVIPYVNLEKTAFFLEKALEAVKARAKEVMLNVSNINKPVENVGNVNNLELAKARELDAMNQQRRIENVEKVADNQFKNSKPKINKNIQLRFTLLNKKKKFNA